MKNEQLIKSAYKPFDIVTDKKNNVGFIKEVNINYDQNDVTYVVQWLVGYGDKDAWFNHDELTMHCNLFIKIAECSCHAFGGNKSIVKDLFNFSSESKK